MRNLLLEQQKAETISISTEFIQNHSEARELKRALAVKLALQGTYAEITKLLGMHKSGYRPKTSCDSGLSVNLSLPSSGYLSSLPITNHLIFCALHQYAPCS